LTQIAKRRKPRNEWLDQPLRAPQDHFQSPKLKDIHPEYCIRLCNALTANLASVPSSQHTSLNIDAYHEKICDTVKTTCYLFPRQPPPKKEWCSTETIKKCIEKNAAWKKYLHSQDTTDKQTYYALHKEVVKAVKADRTTFKSKNAALLKVLKEEKMTTSVLVSLFFPTVSTNSPVTAPTAPQTRMRLSKGSPLLPSATAVQRYLTQLYSKKPDWPHETFSPDPKVKDKCETLLKEAAETLPQFRPPR